MWENDNVLTHMYFKIIFYLSLSQSLYNYTFTCVYVFMYASILLLYTFAQSAVAVEYTDCFSAEE